MKILQVSGSFAECGQQLGEALRLPITESIVELRQTPSWKKILEQASPYWQQTAEFSPLIIEELQGVSQGSGVPAEELFAYMVEELASEFGHDAKACTDVIFTAPATDGRVLVGHNNDLSPKLAKKICVVQWQLPDNFSMLTIGPLGFYVSAGVNSAGLVWSGNELSANDNKIGVPRSLIGSSILMAKNIDHAVATATYPQRASSYNNIISTKDAVLDVEGSANTFAIAEPQEGYLVHANNYLDPQMLVCESKPDYPSSRARQDRAEFLAKQVAAQKPGKVGVDDLKLILRDHNSITGDDTTVCRHGEDSQTLFSMVVDFKSGVEVALGHPCQSEYERVWEF